MALPNASREKDVTRVTFASVVDVIGSMLTVTQSRMGDSGDAVPGSEMLALTGSTACFTSNPVVGAY